MIQEEIIKKFIDLSEGKLNAKEWMGWFSNHKDDVERICGRRAFLGIKPKESFSGIRNLYISQLGAFDWLKSKNINTNLSDLYKEGWEKEFNDFCKQEKQKEKQLQKAVEDKFGHLKKVYPRFFKQLTKSYSSSDTIIKGVKAEEIRKKEKKFSLLFPDDLVTFYQNISKLHLEGIMIDFMELSYETIQKKNYLFLGEFWVYGDGDQLYYNIENQSIYAFAHENHAPKMIKIANSFNDLMEKKIVAYLKEYE
ncbi:SMI1/KNR4 family protein [Chryseobacterium sp. MEBOG06]|uniref:SMI1/KNR4 family protein n=1 Tax=Chryseobacterium sp. MEBOG06 TaxID=2879938 RepID=UPI001F381339|nr:SMI1/KNR4 family protein [Chryseobacterium sp. MEBOG06]UKB83392.1 SMI1/KNR4 family protein [Chryseobacterium sp. MEBOG06]